MDRIIILRIKYAACEIYSVIIGCAVSRVLVTALTDGVSDWADAKRRETDVGKYVCMYLLRRQMMRGRKGKSCNLLMLTTEHRNRNYL